MKSLLKDFVLFIIGGTSYLGIEILYRGTSHWIMAVVGGLAFIMCGRQNKLIEWPSPLWKQSLIGGTLITVLEFVSGVIINLVLKWDVWNYSNYKLNFLGQICVPFSIIWCLLAVIAIIIYGYLRHWLFGEAKPHYRII